MCGQANDDTHLHMAGEGRTSRSEGPVCCDWTVCARALRARLQEPAEVMKARKERGRERGLLEQRGEERGGGVNWPAQRGGLRKELRTETER